LISVGDVDGRALETYQLEGGAILVPDDVTHDNSTHSPCPNTLESAVSAVIIVVVVAVLGVVVAWA
jgi:hypothetical protein